VLCFAFAFDCGMLKVIVIWQNYSKDAIQELLSFVIIVVNLVISPGFDSLYDVMAFMQ